MAPVRRELSWISRPAGMRPRSATSRIRLGLRVGQVDLQSRVPPIAHGGLDDAPSQTLPIRPRLERGVRLDQRVVRPGVDHARVSAGREDTGDEPLVGGDRRRDRDAELDPEVALHIDHVVAKERRSRRYDAEPREACCQLAHHPREGFADRTETDGRADAGVRLFLAFDDRGFRQHRRSLAWRHHRPYPDEMSETGQTDVPEARYTRGMIRSAGTRPWPAETNGSTAGSSSPSRRPASTAGRAARCRRRSAGTCASTRTSAAAQRAGFRACKRCRPEARPGSPEWDIRADVVARAMRLIGDGVVDRRGRDGPGPGRRRRTASAPRLVDELGLGHSPSHARRARLAKQLIETTELRIAEVAFAAGFAACAQFNDTVREVFALTPRELRPGAAAPTCAPGTLRCGRLPTSVRGRARCSGSSAPRAIPGVEEVRRRQARTADAARCRTEPAIGRARARKRSAYVGGEPRRTSATRPASSQRCRRLLDLDADPVSIDGCWRGTRRSRRSVARAAPGLRLPGGVDGIELAVRAVARPADLGPRRAHDGRTSRRTSRHALPSEGRADGVTHVFPTAEPVALRVDGTC